MNGNGAHLGARRNRTIAPRRDDELDRGPDPRLADYLAGPCPGLIVPPPPGDLFVVFELITGRKLAIQEFELLERLRAWAGYGSAVADDPTMAAVKARVRALTVRPDASAPAKPSARPVRGAAFDVDDLGDLG